MRAILFYLLVLKLSLFAVPTVLETYYVNGDNISTSSGFVYEYKIQIICINGYRYTITSGQSSGIVQNFNTTFGSANNVKVITCEQ